MIKRNYKLTAVFTSVLLASTVLAACTEVPQRAVTHNALEDCERQVEEVSALLSMLHRLDANKAQLFSARNSVMASRYSNNEMCFTANVDNLLLQVDKTFNLTNEAK